MNAPGAAAMDLAWLPPSAPALATLTRPRCASLWTQVRHDPGCMLLLARNQGEAATALSANLDSLAPLEIALQFLQAGSASWIDWHHPAATAIAGAAQRQAWLAAELARRVAGCDAERAWSAGLLSPLGWWAVAAVDAGAAGDVLQALDPASDTATCQRDAWGIDHTALTRRLTRLWRLPAWLVPILGHLGLHVRIAERLGAEPRLFQVVQLAVALMQDRQRGLALPIGAGAHELASGLGLPMGEADALAEQALKHSVEIPADDDAWTVAGLADMLRLAIEQRHQQETMSRLQQDLDQLQQALELQCHDEKDRLQALKLSALAELAAGAGHEINNPLAVISGQAQYLLKQIALAEEQLVEDPSPTLYLDSLKAKLHKALTTIVGQAQRIHHVLTDLMQFARPGTPRQQPIALAALVRDTAASLQAAAQDKKVCLTCGEAPADWIVRGDAAQWRTVLLNVLRNALEAAPAEGWVRVTCRGLSTEWAEIDIEDNGPGPAPAIREHLFDPFFSGKNAGRGRGIGLSAAWRLAHQNGGDVRFAGVSAEATRFVLRLPVESEALVLARGPDASSRGGAHALAG